MAHIDEYGTIHRDGEMPVTEKTQEDAIYEEYSRLVYDLSHPERFSSEEYEQKKKRRAEIEQSGVKLDDNNALKFKMAQLKLKAKASNTTLMNGIAKFKKQNG